MKKQKQLDLLEAAISGMGYRLRYEKGSFVGGDCRVRENRVVVVNRFLPIEGKIATIAGVIRKINPPGISADVAKIIDDLAAADLFSNRNE
jgi:hypothetical protein